MKWNFAPFVRYHCVFSRQVNYKYIIISITVRTAVNLSFKIFGDNPAEEDAPPIFIFHGLLGNKKHWNSVGKTILSIAKRSVVSVDLRNHGASPHANSHKYEDLAEDIALLLKKLSIKKASLLGHSMGGRACMCLSLLEPQIVAGLLVVDISPVSNSKHLSEFFPKLFTAMKEVSFKGQKSIKDAKREAKKILNPLIPDDVTMNAVLANIRAKPDHTIGWGCNLDVLNKYFKYIETFPDSLRVKKYPGPTLFVGGQLSEYLPPDDLTAIRRMFPQAVITYLPKTGHNVHIDDPKTFLELAIAFFKTNN